MKATPARRQENKKNPIWDSRREMVWPLVGLPKSVSDCVFEHPEVRIMQSVPLWVGERGCEWNSQQPSSHEDMFALQVVFFHEHVFGEVTQHDTAQQTGLYEKRSGCKRREMGYIREEVIKRGYKRMG